MEQNLNLEFQCRDRYAALSDLARLRDLRTLVASCQRCIDNLSKQPWAKADEIERERQIIRMSKQEIRKLENALTWGTPGLG